MKMTINVSIPVVVKKEGDVFVAACPMLDVASQGCTKKEAKNMLKEAVGLFLVTCIEMGTFSDVLKKCGFAPIQGKPPKRKAKDGFDHLQVPLPFIADRENSGCHA